MSDAEKLYKLQIKEPRAKEFENAQRRIVKLRQPWYSRWLCLIGIHREMDESVTPRGLVFRFECYCGKKYTLED